MRGRAVRSGRVAGSAGKRLPVLRNGCPMPYSSREIFRGSRGDLANASRRPFLRATMSIGVAAEFEHPVGTHGRPTDHSCHRLAPKRPPRAAGRWGRIELGCAISRADSCVAQRLGHGRFGRRGQANRLERWPVDISTRSSSVCASAGRGNGAKRLDPTRSPAEPKISREISDQKSEIFPAVASRSGRPRTGVSVSFTGNMSAPRRLTPQSGFPVVGRAETAENRPKKSFDHQPPILPIRI